MTEFSSMDKDFYLWHLLNYTQYVIGKARQKELARCDISPRESAVFLALQAIGKEATPAKISRWLLREPHSISELLSRMENAGLIRKVKDLTRKNMVRVVLTDKGCEAQNKGSTLVTIHKIMSSLSEEERQQLNSSLRILLHSAQKLLVEQYETTLLHPQWLVPSEHDHETVSSN